MRSNRLKMKNVKEQKESLQPELSLGQDSDLLRMPEEVLDLIYSNISIIGLHQLLITSIRLRQLALYKINQLITGRELLNVTHLEGLAFYLHEMSLQMDGEKFNALINIIKQQDIYINLINKDINVMTDDEFLLFLLIKDSTKISPHPYLLKDLQQRLQFILDDDLFERKITKTFETYLILINLFLERSIAKHDKKETTKIDEKIKFILRAFVGSGILINLSDMDLSGLEFVGIDLSYSNLSGCDLTLARFEHASLNHVNFQGAILNFIMSSSSCIGANMSFSRCQKAFFCDADCMGANFEGTSMGNFHFSLAKIEGSRFIERKGVIQQNIVSKLEDYYKNLFNALTCKNKENIVLKLLAKDLVLLVNEKACSIKEKVDILIAAQVFFKSHANKLIASINKFSHRAKLNKDGSDIIQSASQKIISAEISILSQQADFISEEFTELKLSEDDALEEQSASYKKANN